MAQYLLADFIVNIENQYGFLQKQCTQYEYTGDAPTDFTIRVTDEDIRRERLASQGIQYSPGYLESICAYRKLAERLPVHDALLMHGSVIDCGGRGIGFLARSGVGKTTHTRLWQQVYGETVRIINGDKPILRFFEGIPYAYGTPWAGKEGWQCNDRVRLTDLCFIERGQENAVYQVDPLAYFNTLMVQILHPGDPVAADKTLELLDKLLAACNFWVIQCNVSEDAARVAHDAIIGENKK